MKHRFDILSLAAAAALLSCFECFIFRSIIGARMETYVDAVHWKTCALAAWWSLGVSCTLGCLAVIRGFKPPFWLKIRRILHAAILAVAGSLLTLVFIDLLVYGLKTPPPSFLDLRGLHRASDIPGVLYEPRPGASKVIVREHSGDVLYSINELGYRGRPCAIPKPKGTFRVLVLGDSVTFGVDLSAEERYTEKLESMLNGNRPHESAVSFEVVNISAGGWNTFNQRSWLEHRGPDFDPDMVILQFHVNDVDDPMAHLGGNAFVLLRDIPEEYFPDPRTSERADIIFLRKPDEIPAWDVLNWYLYGRSASWTAVYNAFFHRDEKDPVREGRIQFAWCLDWLSRTDSVQWAWTERQLTAVSRICESRGIPLLVILPPMAYQVNNLEPSGNAAFRNIGEFCSKNGIRYLNLLPIITQKSGNNPVLYYLEGDASHFNAMGHTLIAESVFDLIADEIRNDISQ